MGRWILPLFRLLVALRWLRGRRLDVFGWPRLRRVELKTLFRLASYVTGRRADSGGLVLFDHLFTYFK